ncbi:MAG TPA: hypothetical protein VEO54_17280 [Thermoanaerobaculia bacterium]|nr:hypothetical protein [Thermoanaerobaculia bacterium]
MLKPVSILALDDVAAPLAQAVQQLVAAHHGVDDLVLCGDGLQPVPEAIQSIHARRQRPDSPLRLREDLSTRELVLVVLSASGPARGALIETVRRIREIYETRRFASLVSIEILCLLPEAAGATKPEDYAAAYALLKVLTAEEAKPFDQVWLLDAVNARRVRFGALHEALDVYAAAVAGALTYEPELSGALPGIHPRGMHPTFSSFGYASLVFPREAALQRVEARFAAQLVREKLLAGAPGAHAQLAAKQFVAAEELAVPLSRIGVDGGQSLFRRFQPKTQVNERTRSAEEIIAAVRAELQAFRDSTQLRSLDTLAKQGDETARDFSALLARTLDETLDRDGYGAAQALLEALLDPLPELRPGAELAPRNLVTEIRAATGALDARLRFTPNTAASDAARKRVRELETLIQDQKVVAETLAPADAAQQLGALEEEKEALLREVPEIVFAEERENSTARSAARESEAARLAAETQAKEQELRELFVQLPRAEQALREALETRRTWLWTQLWIAAGGLAAMYLVPFLFGVLRPHLERITWAAAGLALFASFTAFRYVTQIAPLVSEARERLARVRERIAATDQARNAAHNAELQFEYDMTHGRTALRVLRATRDAAAEALESLRTRRQELEELAAGTMWGGLQPAGPCGLKPAPHLTVVDDAEVDAWYERTAEDRKPFLRELPVARSESRRLAMEDVRRRVTAHAAAACAAFGKLTLAGAASSLADPAKLAQRLKRLADTSAPLVELRDDDLQAQQSMQRDCTLWSDTADAPWIAQLQRRFPEAQVKAASDALSAHVVTRVLHYPGYILGQIDYYRAQYEAAASPDAAGVADLLPAELVVGASVRAAYEQLLLGRALGVVVMRRGRLAVSDTVLGDSHLAAAQLLAERGAVRELLDGALVPRLEIAADVSGELRSLRDSVPLTPLDRNVLDGLLRKYV